MTSSLWNLGLACSNFYAYRTLSCYKIGSGPWLLTLLAAISSFLMHISERKHGLPGFSLIKYSSELLWLDRFTCILVFITSLIVLKTDIPLSTMRLALFGGALNAISEIYAVTPERFYLFYITHILWHMIAFNLFLEVFPSHY